MQGTNRNRLLCNTAVAVVALAVVVGALDSSSLRADDEPQHIDPDEDWMLALRWQVEEQQVYEELARKYEALMPDNEELLAELAGRKAEFARSQGVTVAELDAAIARVEQRREKKAEEIKRKQAVRAWWLVGVTVLNLPVFAIYFWAIFGNWTKFLTSLEQSYRYTGRRWWRPDPGYDSAGQWDAAKLVLFVFLCLFTLGMSSWQVLYFLGI